MTRPLPWQWPLWRRWPGRVLLALALLALGWTSLAWWLPGVLRPRIEAAASDALGTPVTLQRLALRPWTLRVEADGLQVGPTEAPLFRLAQAQTQFSLASLWHRAPVLRSLTLQGPQLWVQRLEAQRFNFTPVLEHLRRPSPTPTPPSTEPARFALHNITLRDGAVFYDDRVLQNQHRVEALTLALPFISTLPSDVRTEVQPALSARIDGSQFTLGGEAQPFAADRPAELKVDWQGLALVDWAPLLEAALPDGQAPQLKSGRLDTHLQITFQDPSGPTPAKLRVQGRLAVQDLQVGLPSVAVDARWQSLQMEGIDLAPLEQRYVIGDVRVQGLDASLRRTAAQPDTGPSARPKAAAPAPAAAPAAAQAAPLQWRIERVHCEDCQVRWQDGTVQPAVTLALQQLQLTAGPISQDLSQPIPLDLAARLGGPLRVQGSVQAQPLKVQATLDVQGLALAPLQPYLTPYVNLKLTAGEAGAAGRLDVDERANVHYAGRFGVRGLKTQDGVTGTDFLGWRGLAFDGLDVRTKDGQVDADLGRITLAGLRARVILHPDGHLNFADVRKRSPGEAVSLTTAQADRKDAPAAAPQAPASQAPRLRWQQLTLSDGDVHFTDNFIRPNYSAHVTRLQGQVSALSSSRPDPARLSLTGALDDGAPLRIAGTLNPLAQPLYLDVEGSARGIALTKLSAYSARYAGYAIDKGTLTMTVRYKIEQGRLEAENQLFLDQFAFGEKVDSPEATSLPVRLAVALLKNRRGEIDVRLPITGTLDDPQFSVGGLLWRAFVNLLTRVATAPFALLGGDDAGSLERVDFAPGSAELDDAARGRLDKLAAQLQEHPELKLDITGHADPARDAAPPPSAAGAASAPAAAPAPAAAASAPPDPVRLQTLADARADRVLTYLAGRVDAGRLLLSRAKLEAPEGPAGTGVVLGLR